MLYYSSSSTDRLYFFFVNFFCLGAYLSVYLVALYTPLKIGSESLYIYILICSLYIYIYIYIYIYVYIYMYIYIYIYNVGSEKRERALNTVLHTRSYIQR
jgi:branched-subunit amino acid ABC-type transport system permease component